MIGALGKAVTKYGDEALELGADLSRAVPEQTLDLSGGVARLKDSLPSPTVSELKHIRKRGAQLQNLDSRLMRNKENLEIFDELKGDPKNLMRAAEDNPDLMDLIERYGDDNKKIRSRLVNRIEEADAAQSSQMAGVTEYTDENYRAFGTTRGKEAKRAEEAKLQQAGKLDIKAYLEQHHLLSKGVTGAFMDKMDKLIAQGKGGVEDLLAMGKYAEQQTGTAPGDRVSDILNMRKEPHNRFHTAMEGQGVEESKKAWQKKLESIDSTEELFDEWEKWVNGDGKYTKETAEIWENMEELVDQIQGKV